ncbi:hypothetical protein J6590_027934 [Homalodisca vitripennis]|nr:hypothetical protein J6590_027934 [Homalodisca vitripennis]
MSVHDKGRRVVFGESPSRVVSTDRQRQRREECQLSHTQYPDNCSSEKSSTSGVGNFLLEGIGLLWTTVPILVCCFQSEPSLYNTVHHYNNLTISIRNRVRGARRGAARGGRCHSPHARAPSAIRRERCINWENITSAVEEVELAVDQSQEAVDGGVAHAHCFP